MVKAWEIIGLSQQRLEWGGVMDLKMINVFECTGGGFHVKGGSGKVSSRDF